MSDQKIIDNWNQALALTSNLEAMLGGSFDAYAPEMDEKVRRILAIGDDPVPEKMELHVDEEERQLPAAPAPAEPSPGPESWDPLTHHPYLVVKDADLTGDDVLDTSDYSPALLAGMHASGILFREPIDGSYEFHSGSSVDCGELEEVVEAFTLVVDGLLDVTAKLDSGTYEVIDEMGLREIRDTGKGTVYRLGNPTLHGLPADSVLIWVETDKGKSLGYIQDGAVYMRKE